jgi:hypothetical protein
MTTLFLGSFSRFGAETVEDDDALMNEILSGGGFVAL